MSKSKEKEKRGLQMKRFRGIVGTAKKQARRLKKHGKRAQTGSVKGIKKGMSSKFKVRMAILRPKFLAKRKLEKANKRDAQIPTIGLS